MRFSRRGFLAATVPTPLLLSLQAAPKLHVTAIELLPVRATERTVWLIVRLRTDQALLGIGEASDAFGFASTTKQDALRMESELQKFFTLIEGRSPLDVEFYRAHGEPIAATGGSGKNVILRINCQRPDEAAVLTVVYVCPALAIVCGQPNAADSASNVGSYKNVTIGIRWSRVPMPPVLRLVRNIAFGIFLFFVLLISSCNVIRSS